jgi:hypothetical protein
MRSAAPITFFGQVLDQQEQPLEGARVVVRVRKHNWAFILGAESTTTYRQHELVTDAQGRFRIIGESGRALDIQSITMPGHRFKPRIIGGGNWDTSFYFAGGGVGKAGPHRSDANIPVIFEMVQDKE